MKRTSAILAIIFILGALLAGCGPDKKNGKGKNGKTVSTAEVREKEGYPVVIVTAANKNLSRSIHFTGTVNMPDKVNVLPLVGGVVKEIYVDKGDKVMPGDPLLLIDQTDYRNGVAQAQAAVDMAQAQLALARNGWAMSSNMITTAEAAYDYDKTNLERIKKLYEAGVVSKQDLDGARTKVIASKNNWKMPEFTPPTLSKGWNSLKFKPPARNSNRQKLDWHLREQISNALF